MAGAYYTSSRDMRGNPLQGGVCKYGTGQPLVATTVFPAGVETVTSWRTDGPPLDIDLTATVTYDKLRNVGNRSKLRSGGDTGHTFRQQSRFYLRNKGNFDVIGQNGATYTGPLRVTLGGGFPERYEPRFVNPTELNVGYYGPEAIARTVPTRSRAELLTAAAEAFRDGIPKYIIGAGGLLPQGVGHNVLTKEFGWDPLISDVNKIVASLRDASAMLQQLSRDNGRLVRRRFNFPILETENVNNALADVTSVGGYRIIPETTGGINDRIWVRNSPQTQVEHRVTTREKVWFKGAYIYRLPIPDSIINDLVRFESEFNYLIGSRLTAARLWEVIPFSWLIDWIGNVQSGLAAADALSHDGLVMHHGYLMRHTVRKDTLELKNVVLRNGGTLASVRSGTLTETKERVQASPFGFGLSPDSFTERQWAILASLGLSSSNRRVAW